MKKGALLFLGITLLSNQATADTCLKRYYERNWSHEILSQCYYLERLAIQDILSYTTIPNRALEICAKRSETFWQFSRCIHHEVTEFIDN